MEAPPQAKTSTDWPQVAVLNKRNSAMYQQRKSLPNAPRPNYTESSPAADLPVPVPEPPRGFEELQVYRQLFADIIQQDKTYGAILSTVKAKYDQFVDAKPSLAGRVEQARAEVKNLQETIANEKKRQSEVLNQLFKELRKSKARET